LELYCLARDAWKEERNLELAMYTVAYCTIVVSLKIGTVLDVPLQARGDRIDKKPFCWDGD
jgi:hypothetical protein